MARCNASSSVPPSSGSGSGRTLAFRYGSVCSGRSSTTRSTPCTSTSTVCSPRAIFLMTARVPTVYRSSTPGDSCAGSRWATSISDFSSDPAAASTAASDAARPTDSGMNRPGNRTVFLSGRTGSAVTPLTGLLISALRFDGYAQQASADGGGDAAAVKVTGQLDGAQIGRAAG